MEKRNTQKADNRQRGLSLFNMHFFIQQYGLILYIIYNDDNDNDNKNNDDNKNFYKALFRIYYINVSNPGIMRSEQQTHHDIGNA